MKIKNVGLIILILLGSIASLGCLGTSIKEINQNPQSNLGISVELSGIVFTSEENGLWFDFRVGNLGYRELDFIINLWEDVDFSIVAPVHLSLRR